MSHQVNLDKYSQHALSTQNNLNAVFFPNEECWPEVLDHIVMSSRSPLCSGVSGAAMMAHVIDILIHAHINYHVTSGVIATWKLYEYRPFFTDSVALFRFFTCTVDVVRRQFRVD